MALSRSFVETTITANRIGPDNRDWHGIAEKYIFIAREVDIRRGRSWSCIALEGGTFGEVACRLLHSSAFLSQIERYLGTM